MLFELTLCQGQREESGPARAASLEMEWVRPFPGAVAFGGVTAPPGGIGECLEVVGVQTPGFVGRRQELEGLPPGMGANCIPPRFQRVFDIDLGHLSASTVPDIVP